MAELLRAISGSLQPEERLYVGWKSIGGLKNYSIDDWRKLPWNIEFFPSVEDLEAFVQAHPDRDIYFGVVPRVGEDINALSQVTTLWADLDSHDFNENLKRARVAAEMFPAPPSFVVQSGHGYHAYWLLDGPVSPNYAQDIMRKMCAMLGADSLHNAKTVLRVPGTFNWKISGETQPVKEIVARAHLRYPPKDLDALCALSKTSISMIATGKKHDKPSNSERDWHVIGEMLRLGVSEGTIRNIFEYQPVGSKYRAEGEHYFEITLKKAEKYYETTNKIAAFTETPKGYMLQSAHGPHRVSTFTYEPSKLLIDADGNGQDALLGTMRAEEEETHDVVLPKGAFTTSKNLMNFLPNMHWQWLGSDNNTRHLLLYLYEKWSQGEMQKALGTTVVGRHADYWVTKSETLNCSRIYSPENAPYIFINLGGGRTQDMDTVPSLRYTFPEWEGYCALVREIVPLLKRINREDVISPALGWFMAAPLKTLLAKIDVRFPHLNIYGTTGSGKTSTIEYVLMPLLGVVNPKPWSPNTTTFVLRSLLGSSNGIPVHFGEFRAATVNSRHNDFLRIMLQAHDMGRDARGRSDLSTETFNLLAPIVIDGEDVVGDPAFHQRAIIVNPRPGDIVASSPFYENFKKLTSLPLLDFAGYYLQRTLKEDETSIETRFATALDKTFKKFPQGLPDRVRRNMAVVLLGLDLLNEHLYDCGVEELIESDADMFTPMIHDLILTMGGGPRILIDSFMEDIVNVVANNRGYHPTFIHCYNVTTNTLWIHLASAMGWWEANRRRRGRVSLELPAMRAQIRDRSDIVEAERRIETPRMGYISCVGIKLEAAAKAGLNIPTRLSAKDIAMQGGLITQDE